MPRPFQPGIHLDLRGIRQIVIKGFCQRFRRFRVVDYRINFKIEVKASVVHVCAAYHRQVLIGYKCFGMHETFRVQEDLNTCAQQFGLIGFGRSVYKYRV